MPSWVRDRPSRTHGELQPAHTRGSNDRYDPPNASLDHSSTADAGRTPNQLPRPLSGLQSNLVSIMNEKHPHIFLLHRNTSPQLHRSPRARASSAKGHPRALSSHLGILGNAQDRNQDQNQPLNDQQKKVWLLPPLINSSNRSLERQSKRGPTNIDSLNPPLPPWLPSRRELSFTRRGLGARSYRLAPQGHRGLSTPRRPRAWRLSAPVNGRVLHYPNPNVDSTS